MEENRKLALEKLRNCRELGGLPAAGGKRIRRNCLLRSSDLSAVTANDRALLTKKYRLSLVVDLRTDVERFEKPDVLIRGVDYLKTPVFTEEPVGITREKPQGIPDVKDLPGMDQLYRLMTLDENCRKNFRRILRSILLHDYSRGSVLWHCTEGKDRGGMIAMFLEELLGVDREIIREDYLMTNLENEGRGEKGYQNALKRGAPEAFAEYVRKTYLALPEYLDAVYDAAEEQFGGMENYLMKGLELEPEWIETFREQVLE